LLSVGIAAGKNEPEKKKKLIALFIRTKMDLS
jgi:hypothetical protein